ncbi:MAG: hypothetical protein GY714_01765 [Desulfobacterales bacterium]|nr:hypothetical protein [Desulfobacterales bacterium]
MSTNKKTKVKQGSNIFHLSTRQHDLWVAMRKARRYLTNTELRDITGITWPTNRMSELVSMGVSISKKWIEITDDHGKLIKVRTYKLEAA